MRIPRTLGTLACLCLASLVGAAPVMAAPGWTGPTNVLRDYYPLSPSVVLTRGVFHVAYLHERGAGSDVPSGIFYAANSGGTWHTRRITTGDDFYARPSIAVDDQGFVSIAFARVCFCTPFSSSIWIATNRNGPWQLGRRTSGAQDVAPSLRYAGGALHLAFARVGVGVIYQSKASGSWVSSTVTSAAGACHIEQFPSLAVDGGGTAWVAYERPRFGGCNSGGSSSSGIGVANDAGGAFTSQAISTDTDDQLPDLALDGTGRPHVIFDRAGTGTMYARMTGPGTWVTPVLAVDGNDASLVIDANGAAHIGYEGDGPAYATNQNGTWTTTPLASYGVDSGTNSPVRVVLANTGKARVLFARAEGDGTEDSYGLYLAKER